MTVQDLLDALNKIEDKTLFVRVNIAQVQVDMNFMVRFF